MAQSRHIIGMGAILCGALTLCLSCKNAVPRSPSRAPIDEMAWTGHQGIMMEWGDVGHNIFCTLGRQDSSQESLVMWKWEGHRMIEGPIAKLPESLCVVPASGGLCGLLLGRERGPWPYALVDLRNGEVIKTWDMWAGWSYTFAGGSCNGKFIACMVEEGVDAPGYELLKPKAKIGLIDVAGRDLKWVAELRGHGAGSVMQIAVGDNGRYVALAGWDNGTAMIDAKEGKVLWAKRPEREISTRCAVFAPDEKIIYTAGSGGCVYGIEVATAEVVSQRWATPTGESVYGYRVSALAISRDGEWLAAGTGPEGDVYVWELKRGGNPQLLEHGNGTILVVAFSPDGGSIASAGGGRLKTWSLADGPEP